MGLGWANRIEIVIDSSKINESLTSFPLPIRLSANCGLSSYDASAIFSEVSFTDRKKIAVTLADEETQCYVEIEQWDVGNLTAYLHVKIPFVDSSSDIVLYFWYDSAQSDNTSYVGDTGDTPAQSVWDSNFAAVFHLHQADPDTIGNIIDSTSNQIDSTSSNLESTDGERGGKFGLACNFDQEYLLFGNPAALQITDDITVEVLFKPDLGFGSNVGLATKYIGDGEDSRSWALVVSSENLLRFALSGSGGGTDFQTIVGSTVMSAGTWFYGAGVYDKSETYMEARLNDLQEATSPSAPTTLYNTPAAFSIGSQYGYGPTFCFDGIIDEVRVSTVPRSAAWCDATYYGLFDTLLTVSDPEPPGGAQPVVMFLGL